MDEGGSPIIKVGPLLKAQRNQREQREFMLMNEQRQALPRCGGRSPWCSTVIPAPSLEPWEPWGEEAFLCSFCGHDCLLADVCAQLLYVPICFHGTLLHAVVTDENPSRWAQTMVPHGLTVMAFSGRAVLLHHIPENHIIFTVSGSC